MGTNAVGGMIVAGPEGFQKNQYRKFNIKSTELTPGDDYGMMNEVLRRRFARLAKEEEAGENPPRPDLVLIDGGAGQLAAALEVMADLGVDDIAVVGVAKGPDRDAGLERFFMPGKTPFMLEPKSPVLYYLQRLRDEAHRFAIGTHRDAPRHGDAQATRWTRSRASAPARKRALLHAFGSARGVSRAVGGRPGQGRGRQRGAGAAHLRLLPQGVTPLAHARVRRGRQDRSLPRRRLIRAPPLGPAFREAG